MDSRAQYLQKPSLPIRSGRSNRLLALTLAGNHLSEVQCDVLPNRAEGPWVKNRANHRQVLHCALRQEPEARFREWTELPVTLLATFTSSRRHSRVRRSSHLSRSKETGDIQYQLR
jgi:hypothetical protein